MAGRADGGGVPAAPAGERHRGVRHVREVPAREEAQEEEEVDAIRGDGRPVGRSRVGEERRGDERNTLVCCACACACAFACACACVFGASVARIEVCRCTRGCSAARTALTSRAQFEFEMFSHFKFILFCSPAVFILCATRPPARPPPSPPLYSDSC